MASRIRRSAPAPAVGTTFGASPAWRPSLVLAAATVACLLPFLGTAFRIDEPLFVWMARQIARHPTDPYGFTVNWYGTVVPMAEAMRNPPLVPYVMALWGSIAGWSEASLHALFLLPAVAAVLGTYELASRWCRQPFAAALATLASPALLVSSTSVMCDVTMLACWVWAMACWVRGIEAGRDGWLLSAAVIASACVLAKYNGAGVLALMAVYGGLRRRRFGRWTAYLVLPAAAVGAWLAFMASRYGLQAIEQAAALATTDRAVTASSALAEAGVTLAFAGGSVIAAMGYAVVLRPRWAVPALAAIVVAAWLWAPPLPGMTSRDAWRAVQWWLLVATGGTLVALTVADLRRRLDPASIVLAVWLLGTLVFSGFVSWSVGARYLLPVVPASGLLIARALDARGVHGWRSWAPAAASLAIALAVCRADAALAASARTAADRVLRDHAGRPGTLWYQGHWGFQYYMDLGGAKAVDFDHPWFAPGDVMIVPGNNANTERVDPRSARSTETLEFPASRWLQTLDPDTGAGFYSSVFGPLPFVFGAAAPERYARVVIGP